MSALGSFRRSDPKARPVLFAIVCFAASIIAFAGGSAGFAPALPHGNPPSDLAPASTPTFQNYQGYAGNDAVYLTKYTGATFPATNLSASDTTQTNGGSLDLPNGVASSLSTSPNDRTVYYYTNVPPDSGADQFVLQLFVSTAGASQYLPNGLGTAPEWGVGLIGTGVTYSGLPSEATTEILGYNQVGVNTTRGNINDGSSGDLAPYLSVLAGGLDVALLVVEPEIAVPLTYAAAALDFAGALGGFTDTSYGITSNVVNTLISGDGTVEEWSTVDNGTFNPSDTPTWGSNVFAQGLDIETELGASLVSGYSSTGQITIEAANQLWEFGDSGDYLWGASTSAVTGLKYAIDPADSIQGYVDNYPGGPAVADAQVTLIQDCSSQLTDFVNNANSSGFWQFFANPACSYSYHAFGGYNGYQGQGFTSATVPIPSFGYGSSNNLRPLYLGNLVSFHEKGLSSGTWSITMNGATLSQTAAQTIYFLEANGTYGYTVTLPAGATASGGSVTLSGSNGAVTVTVVPTAPTGVSRTGATTTSVTIGWTNPTIALDGDYVREAPGSSGACGSYSQSSEQPVSTTYAWSGLSAGDAYCFEVIAVGTAGSSSSSGALETATLTSAPTSLTHTSIASTAVTLEWTAPTTAPATGVITSYTVLQATYPAGATCGSYSTTHSTGSSSTSFTVTGLASSTGYCFEVEAVDAGGASSASAALANVVTLPAVIPTGGAPTNNCFGGGSCTGTANNGPQGSGTTCVISSYSETKGDLMYVAVNYLAGTDIITSVSDGGVDSFSYVGGEFATDQSVAFYDVPSEAGGTVTITVTISETRYGTCRVGQLSEGTTVGVVGAGGSTSVSTDTTLSVTNAASHEPSLLMALFSSNRPSGAWTLESPSGAWLDGGQLATGYNPGTESGLYAFNDTTSGTVTFTEELNDSGAYQIYLSGIAIEFYL